MEVEGIEGWCRRSCKEEEESRAELPPPHRKATSGMPRNLQAEEGRKVSTKTLVSGPFLLFFSTFVLM